MKDQRQKTEGDGASARAEESEEGGIDTYMQDVCVCVDVRVRVCVKCDKREREDRTP